ncbi:hypothetical protein Q7O_002844 [Pectobacterium carotovorum subsp. carotovorum PCCS1]|nr:hypothetical protein [Pectobacterium carotovorum subsp. carotovorum PCCS1]
MKVTNRHRRTFGFPFAEQYCIFIQNKCMNIDTILTRGCQQ